LVVLVTGAEGNLGRVLVPELRAGGHHVRTMDSRGGDVRGDVRVFDDVRPALAGVDVVVHAAALHGVHLTRYPAAEFWQTNVTGTFNIYEAARSEGVGRVVLCSTMGVYGARIQEAAVIDEDSPVAPTDIYAMSKALCEQLALAYTRIAGISTVALRLGMFVPETWERYGFRLLFGGVDDRDVAEAVRRAVEYEPPAGFDVMNVMAEVPFDDPLEFAHDPAAVIERHWPGTLDLGFDIDSLVWGKAIWRSDRAQRVLGWRPRYGFDEFLAAHRAGDQSHYPAADSPQWGVEE
jgi:nucleoside-diphosphate-sugar epimerase